MAVKVREPLEGAIQLLNDITLGTSDMTLGNAWTGVELFGYLREALRIIAKRTRAYRGMGTIALQANVATYNLPADCIEPLRFLLAGRVLTRRTLLEMDRCDPSWETRTGTPTDYIPDALGPGKVVFHPTPTAATVASYHTVAIRHVKLPTMPTEPTGSETWDDVLDQELDLPEVYGNAPMYYILARAYGKDGELQSLERSQTYMDAFDGFVSVMAADVIKGFDRAPQAIPYRNF